MSNLNVIYYYTNIKNGMQYIGQTNNLKKRNREHKNNKSDTYFDREYHAHPNDFILDYIECDECLLNFMEQYYIFWFQSFDPSGYNLTLGGNGCRGCSPTKETRRKIGIANSKYKRTNEQKEYLRQINLGKKHSNETKEKCKIASQKYYETHKGPWSSKKQSQEMIDKRSNSLKEYYKTNDGPWKDKKLSKQHIENIRKNRPNKKKVICDETKIIYDSIQDASRKTKICASQISDCCNGKRKTAGKYHWRFYYES